MIAPLPSPRGMSAQEYFDWEAQQLERHDFYEGEVFAMSGASDSHNLAASNALVALTLHLRGTPCRVFTSDMRLQLAANRHYCHPDVFVTCDPRDRTPESRLLKQHPRLVVEVLSPSTADCDRGLKFEQYRQLESLEEVLFIDADRRVAELYQRGPAPQWLMTPARAGDVLHLRSVDLQLEVAALFVGLDDEEPASATPSP
jgi:Uma2 family endonuclease